MAIKCLILVPLLYTHPSIYLRTFQRGPDPLGQQSHCKLLYSPTSLFLSLVCCLVSDLKKKKKTCKEHMYNTGNINLHDFFSSDLSLFLSILSHQYSLDEGMKTCEVIYKDFLLSVPFTFRQKDFLFTEMWSLFWHLQLVDDFCFYCATRHSSSYQQAKVPFSVEVLDTFHVFCLLPSRAHQTFS